MSKIKKIVLSAVLLALMIVFERLISIKTPLIRISLGFIPLMLSAIWLGAKWSVLIAVLADLIGSTLFPYGAYFLGYTVSSGLSGLVYGLFLHKNSFADKEDKKLKFVLKLTVSSLIVLIFINAGLNTVWTTITAKAGVLVIAPMRIIKQLIMLPVQVIIIYALELALRKPLIKFLRSNND